MLLQHFIQHIEKEHLFAATHRLLVAVSGGLDSVVLADLVFRAGYDMGLAHVNFKLRGDASTGDAEWVQNLAANYGIPFYLKEVDTLSEIQPGESVQMAARRLRYTWLEEIRQTAGYDFILTAHHAHDNLETLLMRFIQGSGLAGMRGIPPVNGYIKRPLLGVPRPEIASYALQQSLGFREDASNQEDYYLRNKIRHHLTPLVEEINPAITTTLTEQARLMREAHQLYQYAVRELKDQLWTSSTNGWDIDRLGLNRAPGPRSLLYEWLSPLGFSSEQCRQVLEARPGTLLKSDEYSLLIEEEKVHLRPLYQGQDRYELLEMPAQLSFGEGEKITFSLHNASEGYTFSLDTNLAYVDYDKLQFPLVLRHWQAGDWFCPLGMKGQSQKLQDYFVNRKINRQQRQRQWVLQNGQGDLIWLPGLRADERYKITETTQHYVILHYICEAI